MLCRHKESTVYLVAMAYAADEATLSDLDHNLLEAVHVNDVDATQQAIRNKANVNCIDSRTSWSHGDTPLIIACKRGHADIARILLDAGANARCLTRHGLSAFFAACRDGHLLTV